MLCALLGHYQVSVYRTIGPLVSTFSVIANLLAGPLVTDYTTTTFLTLLLGSKKVQC